MADPATDLLVIGAGPYGLAAAAIAQERLGLAVTIIGEPMEFWHRHMPVGMRLRSGPEWHLDPSETRTFEAFLAERRIAPGDVTPIPTALFLEYATWFRERVGLTVTPGHVEAVRRDSDGFIVRLADGGAVRAGAVVATPGFAPFAHRPPELQGRLPAACATHTCDLRDPATLAGQRVVIVGGRQSAYETAALLAEAGAATVDVVHRHPTPAFAESDWSWTGRLLVAAEATPAWFQSLPATEQDAIAHRFWEEGRLKLEPWLAPRLAAGGVRSWPDARVADVGGRSDGGLSLRLDGGTTLAADHVVLATGYRVDIQAVPYLRHPSVSGALAADEGFPRLDQYMQSTVPGLFLAGLVSTRAFGPFFGFVRGCPLAGRLIARGLDAR